MVRCAALLPALLAALPLAAAHTRVYGISVNGVDAGDGRGKYVRTPPNNSPVKDVSSPAINCNVANTAVPSSVPANPGDKIDIEWFHDNRGDDIIAASHKGPVTVYLASADSNGQGAVWTKIAEDGLSGGQWAVDKLIANKGKHSVTLPAGLAAGEYLMRAEVIGLHEAEVSYKENPARGAQFYPNCIQLKVGGSGSTKLQGGFDFAKGYSSEPTNKGIVFNIYGGNLAAAEYPIPGPAVGGGGGGASAATPPSSGGAGSGAGASSPAQSGAPPAQSGAPPAQSGAPPAQSGAPLAQSGAPAAGDAGAGTAPAPPAQGGAPPVQSGAPPAQSGAPTFGAPAQGGAPTFGAPPATSGSASPGAPPAAGGAPPQFPGMGGTGGFGGMFGSTGGGLPAGFRRVRRARRAGRGARA